ncbi:Magnesium and cobalt efflux protein CorC [Mariniblastus fucicola]|uniref:Magnesium and cobalt efflux protein CorC n=1 Tax=Mariniblastus fucicola TaxID=980251 RepID=A0A5B9P6D4_9BACT|nr:Magnesium and cobalt efflux protein CorC [Mariniblastus fucicola]
MLYAWLTFAGLAITTLASTANRCLYDIAWHELEMLCQKYKREELFGRILDLREQLEFGVGILQAVAISLTACFAYIWLMGDMSTAGVSTFNMACLFILVSFALVACSVWIPWAVAKIGAEKYLYFTWRWWWLVSVASWPLLIGGKFVGTVFQRASGTEDDEEDEEDAFEEEILSILSEAENDGVVEAERADMIEGVMDLDDFDITKVMTPRSRIDALDVSSSWEKMLKFAVDSGRTRIPVFEEKIDNVLGVLFVKDLLSESLRNENKRRPLRKLLREPILAPAATKLDEMLKTFLAGRMHMAVVTDEYGGLAGVVTIEDILEEIVGEIEDETDSAPPQPFKVININEAEIAAELPIDELNEKLGLTLPEEEEYATVGGLLMAQNNRIPRVGHEIEIDEIKFIILEANRRSIRRVRVVTPTE